MDARNLSDRYEVEEPLGHGGMADVVAATDTRLGRRVAIKILREDLARDPAFVRRFESEALAAARLNHPGIVSVFDVGEEQPDARGGLPVAEGHVGACQRLECVHNKDLMCTAEAVTVGGDTAACTTYEVR